MDRHDPLIDTSRIIVRCGIVLNRLFFGAICIGLLLSWLFAGQFAGWLIASRPGGDAAALLVGLRFEMLIGLVASIATDRLLTALGRMIDSARDADPFNVGNARRLQTIGWALLVLQLLDLCGIGLTRALPVLGSAAPDGNFSVGGWVAVLMVFILARVFATGAVMREELAGTI